MKNLVKRATAGFMFATMIMTSSGLAFAAENPGNPPVQPAQPQVESYRDNDRIEAYNQEVDRYNSEAQSYNQAVDQAYADAVRETGRQNEEISRHNAAEEQRVSEAAARNEQAQAQADAQNRQIDEDNAAEEARVNRHNTDEDQKVKASEDAKAAAEAENKKISQHNAAEQQKADEYNAQVDSDYADAVEAERARIEEIKAKNEEIRRHNADEDQKVSDTAAFNQEEEARIAQINEEREAQYLIDVEQYNADKEQYDKDYAQYQTDKAWEQKIKAAGYESVEQYNDLINYYYNEPAAKAEKKNASAKEVSISDTYSVEAAAEKSGRTIPVRIEHHFTDVNLDYVEEFEIDANDIITVMPISAAAETTSPGYAQFYYLTDDNHLTGYWWETDSYVATNANFNEYGWNCGDTHKISFKDGKGHAFDEEDITVVYNYTWNPLRKAKTYNVPKEPTKPTVPVLELLNFEPITYEPQYQEELDETENAITKGEYYTPDLKDLLDIPELYTADYQTFNPLPHVLPVLEDITEADIWELLPDPVKKAYVDMLNHMALFEVPAPAAPSEPTDPTEPTKQAKKTATTETTEAASPALQNPVSVYTTPFAAFTNTSRDTAPTVAINDELTPLTALSEESVPAAAVTESVLPESEDGAWALVNLIAAVLTALIGVLTMAFYFIKKREDDEDEQTEDDRINRKLGTRLLGLIAGIGAVIAFILTEDMTLPMQMTDRWTLMMIIILLIGTVAALASRKTKEESEETQAEKVAA